jgi:hypothetical protein
VFGLYDAFETLHMKSQEWWLFSASHTSPANPAELTLLCARNVRVGLWDLVYQRAVEAGLANPAEATRLCVRA